MREARGFAVVKLSVMSTHMSALYNGYLNRIGVVVRGAKSQHHENKIKKKRVPIDGSMSGMSTIKAINIWHLNWKAVTYRQFINNK